ncbi:MAG: sacsin N-terminal ATP-binding-like domain-containing protein [Actinomycetota bacterium]
MTGFIPTPLSYIADLKGILRDQYDSRSILKELLQNADDARAEQLHLGFHGGWKEAQHPLLRGPSLVVLNDGSFEEAHAGAIRRPRVGTKGAQADSIGRFGLGMKSVFHLCEAFFFLASASQPVANGRPYVQLLNPWHATGFHPEWDSYSPEWERLWDAVNSWSHGCDPWFCLWLPLRRKQHLMGVDPIVANEPSLQTLIHSKTLSELAVFFPLLRNVRQVAIWKTGEWNSNAEATLRVEEGVVRSAFPHSLLNGPRYIQGTAHIEGRVESVPALFFAGREELRKDPDFVALQGDDWPCCVTVDPVTAEVTLKKEEIVPHSAAVWVRTPAPANGGTFEIRHGVFLPLAECLEEPTTISGKHCWLLLLHGCFFLDAARKSLLPSNRWNRIIQQRALHDAVIPALERAVAAGDVPEVETAGLTRALSLSRWFNDFRDEVCRTDQWVRTISPTGAAWRRLPAVEPLWNLPLPQVTGAARDRLPFEALPGLRDAAGSRHLVFSHGPRLSRIDPRNWHEDLGWLKGLPAETLTDPARLEYLFQFLQQERDTLDSQGWIRICSALAAALAAADLNELRKNPAPFQRLVSLLPQGAWHAFPGTLTELPNTDRALRELWGQGLSTLLIPETLAPTYRGSRLTGAGTLSLRDASAVFSWLVPPPPALPPRLQAARADLAFWVLEHSSASREDLLTALGEYPVFRVYDLSQKQDRLATWRELTICQGRGLLFTAGGAFRAEPLQTALPKAEIIRLREDSERASRVLFDGLSLTAVTREVCIHLLAGRPVLGPPEDRAALLTALATSGEGNRGPEYRRALRYLLHGSGAHYEDITASLISAGALGGRGVLVRAAERLLQSGASRWRSISQVLGNKLNGDLWDELGLVTVSPGFIEQLLKEAGGADTLHDLPLSTPECEELLFELRYLPDGQWKSLPLHAGVTGERACLDAASYYENPISLAPVFSGRVRLVAAPEHEGLRSHYERCLRGWGHEAALRTAIALLRDPDAATPAADLFPVMLGHFAEAANAGRLPDDLRQALRKERWLPSPWATMSPGDVLDLPGMEDELARVLRRESLQGMFIELTALPTEARDPAVLSLLRRELFMPAREALEALGECLVDTGDYALGELTGPWEPEHVEELLLAFDALDPELLPAYPLLRAAHCAAPDLGAAAILIERLLAPIPPERHLRCLAALSNRHQAANAAERPGILRIHLRYLEYLAQRGADMRTSVRQILLLNRRGRWKSPDLLCIDAAGIDDADLLHRDQAAVLGPLVARATNGRPAPGTEIASAASMTAPACDLAAILREYFEPWTRQSDLVPECIGGLLAFMGGTPDVQRLAETYLGSRYTLAAIRDQVEWRWEAETLDQAMRRHRLALRVVDALPGDTYLVTNLLGEHFEARVSRDFDHLFLGEVRVDHRVTTATQVTFTGDLRRISPAEFGRRALEDLLTRSIEHLVYRLFNQRPSNVGSLMCGLANSDQLDLQVTQEKILQNAFAYFRMLDGGRLTGLRDLVVQWDLLYYREQEQLTRTAGASLEETHREREELRRRLRELLEGDLATQSETLEAVAHRVRQSEYRLESIPFELFQNADDAVVELGMMAGEALPPAASRVVLSWTGKELALLHWGRPVNVFRSPTFSEQDGVRRGFHDDLAKMLLLSASDKSTSSGAVTGKFGLGFKSVFLMTDLPRMLSGQLGFEVVGGLFPRKLAASERERMGQRLRDADPDARAGSIIELPARPGVSAEQATSEFRQLAHVLLVFARRLKTCVLQPPAGPIQTLSWRGRDPFPGAPGIRCGELRAAAHQASPAGPPEADRFGTSEAFVLSGNEHGSVLLVLDTRGFTALPAAIPTFWVTAPTRTRLGAGLAVNAPFALDIGRTQLALENAENHRLSLQLGVKIGKQLVALFDAAGDWSTTRAHLRLADDVKSYEFWHSLWNLVGSHLSRLPGMAASAGTGLDREGERLLQSLFWSPEGGAATLYAERPALPTGLCGKYKVLTRLSEVRWSVTGVLEGRAMFEQVSMWRVFRSEVQPGEAVSQREVVAPLQQLCSAPPTPRALRLARVWEWEWRVTPTVSKEQAERWGRLVTPELLARLERDEDGKTDLHELDPYRRKAQFRTVSGEFRLARDLLVPQRTGDGAEEERWRSRFAPEDRLLHQDYTGEALLFFEACRGAMAAGAEVLAAWGRGADSRVRQRAFLDYLVSGELAAETARHARSQAAGTWLERIEEAPVLQELSPSEQAVVLGHLHQYQKPAAHVVGRTDPPVDALERIHAWWDREQSRALQNYLELTYPGGGDFLQNIEDPYNGRPAERRAWLLLFLRGALESSGWCALGQHRNFLHLLDQRGLIRDVLENPDDPASILDGFWAYLEQCADEVKYYQSFKQYLPLAMSVRWLDDYARSFLSGNDAPKFNLQTLLRPRLHSAFGHDDPDAPPLAPLLQMGAHFVLRELVRIGVVRNQGAVRDCYVPAARTCRLVSALGGPDVRRDAGSRMEQSRAIHAFLKSQLGERATFNDSFDIPLWLLATDARLRAQVLDGLDLELDEEDADD